MVGVYDESPVWLKAEDRKVNVLNGKLSNEVVIHCPDHGRAEVKIYTCKGELVSTMDFTSQNCLLLNDVPAAGIVTLELIKE